MKYHFATKPNTAILTLVFVTHAVMEHSVKPPTAQKDLLVKKTTLAGLMSAQWKLKILTAPS
jgi:hypothetical protein